MNEGMPTPNNLPSDLPPQPFKILEALSLASPGNSFDFINSGQAHKART